MCFNNLKPIWSDRSPVSRTLISKLAGQCLSISLVDTSAVLETVSRQIYTELREKMVESTSGVLMIVQGSRKNVMHCKGLKAEIKP